jgi:hypothetical protein
VKRANLGPKFGPKFDGMGRDRVAPSNTAPFSKTLKTVTKWHRSIQGNTALFGFRDRPVRPLRHLSEWAGATT